MSVRSRSLSVFSTGNEELDGRLGGGIPHPAFILIEGENGTAKTTLATQVMFGALNAGYRVVMFTTETTAKQFIFQTRLISLDLTKFYIKGQLVIYSLYAGNYEASAEALRTAFDNLIQFLLSPQNSFDIVVIDSLTVFLNYVGEEAISRFIQTVRRLVARGSSLLATMHSGIVEERVARALRAASDVYYKLGLANVGGKTVKVLQIVKARGAPEPIEGTLAFDVDPAFGIKIVPVVIAQS